MTSLDLLFERWDRYRDEGSYEELISVLKEIIEAEDPGFISIHEMELAKAFAHLKNSKNALYYANKSLTCEGSKIGIVHLEKCKVLHLLGMNDDADELANQVLLSYDESIKEKERNPAIFGLPHRSKAAVLISYFQDFSEAASLLQVAIDKKLFSDELQHMSLIGTIQAYKAGVDPVGSVGSMLGAIMTEKYDEIENYNGHRIQRDKAVQRVIYGRPRR
jgi:tetratricopeptide (TPR) repeat protein